jgi:hypothetical protein
VSVYVFSAVSLNHVIASSFFYTDFAKCEFKGHVKTLEKKCSRNEIVNPATEAQTCVLNQSTHLHFTSAFDKSVLGLSYPINKKILAT